MNGNDIECAFIGRLGADPESRTAKSGKTYARLNVAVGEGETSQWVQVTVFADAAEKVLALREGDKVYIEAHQATGRGVAGLGARFTRRAVAAFRAHGLGQIGERRRKTTKRGPE